MRDTELSDLECKLQAIRDNATNILNGVYSSYSTKVRCRNIIAITKSIWDREVGLHGQSKEAILVNAD